MNKFLLIALLSLVSFAANSASLFYSLHSIATYNPFAPTGTRLPEYCCIYGGVVLVDSGSISTVSSINYAFPASNQSAAYNYTQGVWSAVVGGTSVTHTETCTEAAGLTRPCTSALSGLSGVWNSTQANGGGASHTCAATAFFAAGLCDRVSIVELPGNVLTIIEQSEFAISGFGAGFIYEFFPVPIPTAAWLFGSAIGVIGVMRRKIA